MRCRSVCCHDQVASLRFLGPDSKYFFESYRSQILTSPRLSYFNYKTTMHTESGEKENQSRDSRIRLPCPHATVLSNLNTLRAWDPSRVYITADFMAMTKGADLYGAFSRHVRDVREIRRL